MQTARFENVFCSQCGVDFGPGEHGFSHCDNHQGMSMQTNSVHLDKPVETSTDTSADARDAARYRWLRDKSDSGNLDLPYPVKRKYVDGKYMQFAFEPAELDAAIDAALAKTGAA